MEATFFAFGVLTMVLVATAAIAVYSTVKVLRIKKSLERQENYMTQSLTELYRSTARNEDLLRRNNEDQIKEIYDRINRDNESIWRRTEELNSYVDRRFDKLVDTYFAIKDAEKQTKKIING
jgi:uncharacterized protein HemX